MKTFGKLRRQEIAGRPLRKYFLYALGEIALIVVGILIALRIDTWNQQQKDAVTEQKILAQLETEYERNLAQLDEKIAMRAESVQAGKTLLRYIDAPDGVPADSVIFQMTFVIRDPTFDPISNDLIASGNLLLIRNERLKNRLANWTSEVRQLQEAELEWQKIRTQVIIPFLIRNGLDRSVQDALWKNQRVPVYALDRNIDIPQDLGPSRRLPDAEALLAMAEIEGIASETITWAHLGNLQSLGLRNRLEEILQLIRAERDPGTPGAPE